MNMVLSWMNGDNSKNYEVTRFCLPDTLRILYRPAQSCHRQNVGMVQPSESLRSYKENGTYLYGKRH